MYAEVATRISCTRPFPAKACAAFCEESRMESEGTWGAGPEPALSEIEGCGACGRTESGGSINRKTCFFLGRSLFGPARNGARARQAFQPEHRHER